MGGKPANVLRSAATAEVLIDVRAGGREEGKQFLIKTVEGIEVT